MGLIPSTLQSADTEVSRCAIAAWASRTWAFDSANFLPPLCPRGREPGQGAFADQLQLELGQRREHGAAGPPGATTHRPAGGSASQKGRKVPGPETSSNLRHV